MQAFECDDVIRRARVSRGGAQQATASRGHAALPLPIEQSISDLEQVRGRKGVTELSADCTGCGTDAGPASGERNTSARTNAFAPVTNADACNAAQEVARIIAFSALICCSTSGLNSPGGLAPPPPSTAAAAAAAAPSFAVASAVAPESSAASTAAWSEGLIPIKSSEKVELISSAITFDVVDVCSSAVPPSDVFTSSSSTTGVPACIQEESRREAGGKEGRREGGKEGWKRGGRRKEDGRKKQGTSATQLVPETAQHME